MGTGDSHGHESAATATAPPARRVREHRVDVVRRLLDRGVDPETLSQILPGWQHLLTEIAIEHSETCEGRTDL